MGRRNGTSRIAALRQNGAEELGKGSLSVAPGLVAAGDRSPPPPKDGEKHLGSVGVERGQIPVSLEQTVVL